MTEPRDPLDPIDPALTERLQALAVRVREASQSAQVLTLEEAWTGTEEEYLQAAGTAAMPDCEDIVFIRDNGRLYLFSDRLMTLPYAEAVARAQCDDKRHV